MKAVSYIPLFLAAAASCAVIVLAHAQEKETPKKPAEPPALKIKSNVAYCGTDDPMQALDVYFPEKPSKEPAPVVVYLHGGGWIVPFAPAPPIETLDDARKATRTLRYSDEQIEQMKRTRQRVPAPASATMPSEGPAVGIVTPSTRDRRARSCFALVPFAGRIPIDPVTSSSSHARVQAT